MERHSFRRVSDQSRSNHGILCRVSGESLSNYGILCRVSGESWSSYGILCSDKKCAKLSVLDLVLSNFVLDLFKLVLPSTFNARPPKIVRHTLAL